MKIFHLDLNYSLVLFFINITFFLFISFSLNDSSDSKVEGLFIHEGETSTYFEPLENFLIGKGYTWTTSTSRFGDFKEVPSTRRVPGIGLVYIPLRLIMSKSVALNALVLTQWLLHILSWILLIGSLKEYLNIQSSRIIWTIVLLSSFSTFDKIFNSYGLAESLSNSALISSLALYILFQLKSQNKYLLLAGCFSAWSIFLRPATGLFWAVCIIVMSIPILFHHFSMKKINSILIYAIPLLVSLASWGLRNYTSSGALVLLEDNIFNSQPALYTPIKQDIRFVSLKLGERFEPWIDGSFGQFVFQEENSQKDISDFAWNNQSSELILKMKALDKNARNTKNRSEIVAMDKRSTLIRAELINSMKHEIPFRYYFISRIAHLKDLLNKKFYSYLPFPALNEMTLIQKTVKVFEAVYHYLLLAAFFTLIVLKPSLFGHKVFAPLLIFPLFYTLVMSLVLGAAEPRYIIPIYPFLIVSFFILIWHNQLNFKK